MDQLSKTKQFYLVVLVFFLIYLIDQKIDQNREETQWANLTLSSELKSLEVDISDLDSKQEDYDIRVSEIEEDVENIRYYLIRSW
jgi:hypothetical protein